MKHHTKIKTSQLIAKKMSYSNILENFKTQDKKFNQYKYSNKTRMSCYPWKQRQVK